MGDADDTYDFCGSRRLVAPLNSGADMVARQPVRRRDRQRRDALGASLHRQPDHQSRHQALLRDAIGDSQSGFRAFRRGVTERLGLRSSGMELASEMIVSAARAGMTIAEVPAPYAIRRGESKLNAVRDGWRHLRFLLLAAPDFLFILPGTLAALFGACSPPA